MNKAFARRRREDGPLKAPNSGNARSQQSCPAFTPRAGAAKETR